MAASLTPDVMEDEIAIALANVLAAANRRARELGIDLGRSLISITPHSSEQGSVWRVSYGPQDYIGRRGGDLVIDVTPTDASILGVRRGQ